MALFGGCVALLLAGGPFPARGTQYGTGTKLWLSDFQITSNVTVSWPKVVKTVWDSSNRHLPAFTLSNADTLSLQFYFNKLIQVTDHQNPVNTNEMIYWVINGSGTLAADQALPYVWSFSHVTGSLSATNISGVGVLRSLPDGVVQGVINASQAFRELDLTGNSFSFAGIWLTVTIPNIASGWTINSVRFSVAGDSVAIFPPFNRAWLSLSGRSPVVLSWPTNLAGFGLLTTTDLNNGSSWKPAGLPWGVQGTNYTATNSSGEPARFFRLTDGPRRACLNNLAQLGMALQMWAMDNGDQFPFQVSTNWGGSREWRAIGPDGFDTNAYAHFQVMSNELGSTSILVCPSDLAHTAAAEFPSLGPENVTYRLRTGDAVSVTNPDEVLAVCPVDGNTLYCDGLVLEGVSR